MFGRDIATKVFFCKNKFFLSHKFIGEQVTTNLTPPCQLPPVLYNDTRLVERVTENGEKPLRTRHCNRLFKVQATHECFCGECLASF
jgi:hypothetical protein